MLHWLSDGDRRRSLERSRRIGTAGPSGLCILRGCGSPPTANSTRCLHGTYGRFHVIAAGSTASQNHALRTQAQSRRIPETSFLFRWTIAMAALLGRIDPIFPNPAAVTAAAHGERSSSNRQAVSRLRGVMPRHMPRCEQADGFAWQSARRLPARLAPSAGICRALCRCGPSEPNRGTPARSRDTPECRRYGVLVRTTPLRTGCRAADCRFKEKLRYFLRGSLRSAHASSPRMALRRPEIAIIRPPGRLSSGRRSPLQRGPKDKKASSFRSSGLRAASPGLRRSRVHSHTRNLFFPADFLGGRKLLVPRIVNVVA
jgi:hypothetical protein